MSRSFSAPGIKYVKYAMLPIAKVLQLESKHCIISIYWSLSKCNILIAQNAVLGQF